MPNYRRAAIPGATYFFTVVSHQRQPILCDDAFRTALRAAITTVQNKYTFNINAWVLLPDHLHCIWTLPENDHAYSMRWSMIKRLVTQAVGAHGAPYGMSRHGIIGAHGAPYGMSRDGIIGAHGAPYEDSRLVGRVRHAHHDHPVQIHPEHRVYHPYVSSSRLQRREGVIWQRRFWEHRARDQADLNRCLDYLHWNPVKHGYVTRVADWPYSTFHRFVREGIYPQDWGGQGMVEDGAFGE
jgi:putative transposase